MSLCERAVSSTDVVHILRVAILALLSFGVTVIQAPAQISGDKPSGPVDEDLLILAEEYEIYLASGSDAPFEPDNPLVVVRDSLVLVDAVASTDGPALLAALESIGLQAGAVWQRSASGWLPILAVRLLDQLDELHSIRPSYRTRTGTGIGLKNATLRTPSSSVFPNPFRDRTSVRYTLTEEGSVRLTVYDIVGRAVLRMSEPFRTAGSYEIRLERSDLSQGVYVLLLEMPNGLETRSMTIVG